MMTMTPERARGLLSRTALTPGEVAEVLRHVLTQAAEQAVGAPPAPLPTKPGSNSEVTERHQLNAFLDKLGYRRSGDLVYLKPALVSRTAELRRPEHAVVAVIGTGVLDGSDLGQTFDPHGCRFDRFRKNPVVLYSHDYEGLPVARSLWERVRDGDHGPEMAAKPQFHMDTCLSREVWQVIMDGRLSAWELGVVPEKWEARGDSFLVTAWDVLEYSVVPRPEDIPALREERRQRRITAPALVKSIMADMEKGEEDNGE